MKNFFLLVCFLFLFFLAAQSGFSQDIITLHDSTRIEAKVISITSEHVRYKEHDYPDGPVIVLHRSEVYKLRYPNGTERILSKPQASPEANNPDVDYAAPSRTAPTRNIPLSKDYYNNRTPEERALMAETGAQEARDLYQGSSTRLGVGLATLLGGGVGGIFVGGLAFITPPDVNLHPVSHPSLRRDPDFRKGYEKEAHRKKKGKVASGFGIGFGVLLVVLTLAYN